MCTRCSQRGLRAATQPIPTWRPSTLAWTWRTVPVLGRPHVTESESLGQGKIPKLFTGKWWCPVDTLDKHSEIFIERTYHWRRHSLFIFQILRTIERLSDSAPPENNLWSDEKSLQKLRLREISILELSAGTWLVHRTGPGQSWLSSEQ